MNNLVKSIRESRARLRYMNTHKLTTSLRLRMQDDLDGVLDLQMDGYLDAISEVVRENMEDSIRSIYSGR